MPYLFLRTLDRPPATESPGGGADYELRLPYIAFLERHRGRWSPFWEEGRGQWQPIDMTLLLRVGFLVRAGTAQETELRTGGETVARQLNEIEEADGTGEPLALTDCAALLREWPTRGDPGRTPLFVAADNFNSWDHQEYVWRDIRLTPVRFQPIPAEDTDVLNKWLFGRYRFPKAPERLSDALNRAIADAPRRNSPRKLMAEALLEGTRHTEGLIRLATRST